MRTNMGVVVCLGCVSWFLVLMGKPKGQPSHALAGSRSQYTIKLPLPTLVMKSWDLPPSH